MVTHSDFPIYVTLKQTKRNTKVRKHLVLMAKGVASGWQGGGGASPPWKFKVDMDMLAYAVKVTVQDRLLIHIVHKCQRTVHGSIVSRTAGLGQLGYMAL